MQHDCSFPEEQEKRREKSVHRLLQKCEYPHSCVQTGKLMEYSSSLEMETAKSITLVWNRGKKENICAYVNVLTVEACRKISVYRV